MPSHFVQSANARTLSLAQMAHVGTSGAFHAPGMRMPREMSGDPVYPDCGRVICYDYRAGQLCERCGRQFGVTTGTAFDGRQLAIWHNLMADPWECHE